MRIRGELGTTRVGRRPLVGDVDVRAIPFLPPPYRVIGVEQLGIGGDAPKNFIEVGPTEAYIAKAPRRNGPRECVTEYLISCIGRLLPVKVAEGRLVRLPSTQSEPDVRFMSRFFLQRNEEHLTHGIELVAQTFEEKPADLERILEGSRKEERRFYTIDIVDGVLRSAMGKHYPRVRDGFARMMAFDALVGANDRHARNWGVIQNVTREAPVVFAPIFDTARGVFWNFSDEQLADHEGDRGRFIKNYAERSNPLISVPQNNEANHFDVVAYMTSPKGGCRDVVRSVVGAFCPDEVSSLLHRTFRRLFTRRRLQFVDDLLRLRHAKLISVCKWVRQ